MTDFNLVYALAMIVVAFGAVMTSVGYLTLAERKISAYMQDRVGPDRVGPFGLLQPLADGLKMFFKEDATPKHVDKIFFFLAPGVGVATALLAFSIVPFGPSTPPPGPVSVDAARPLDLAVTTHNAEMAAYHEHTTFAIAPGLDIGILFSFAIGSLVVYGIILGGWSSNSKYSLLGSLRSSAQIISYEIPLGMSIVGVVLYAGSLNLEAIMDYQIKHGWFILYQPLAFLLFLVAVYAECNRLPFDLPEAEQELVGGFHTEYSSMKFALYFLAEYTHVITISFLTAILFFGGWHFPGIAEPGSVGLLPMLLKLGVLMSKVFAVIIVIMLIRWTIPRFRFDQLMGLAWKVLIPLSMANVVAVMTVLQFGWSRWWLTIISVLLFLIAGAIGVKAAQDSLASGPRRMKPKSDSTSGHVAHAH